MKIYQSSTDYSGYSFPTVSLAYFLRYPNPLAKHVLSTDTISQHIDPVTRRLHTVRLHLKRSKVPAGILKFLPKTMSGPDGSSQTYILEKTVVDVKEGWMETESRNLELTGVLSVIEKQMYRDKSLAEPDGVPGTRCNTTVTLVSRLGQTLMKRRKSSHTSSDQSVNEIDAPELEVVEEEQPKQGWFASVSTAGIQRTIELVGMKRTKTAATNSAEGMKIVLERLRQGGVKGVIEGMRRDRMEMMPAMMADGNSADTPWRDVWQRGAQANDTDRREGRRDGYD
ncbi:hypothetical protein OHC33_010048 [Knufia fluminis]|uniref:PRELI/MSF1 domain-containing protein n=1 Tax=Knufia fluminis TaxID=191047 RepID=A0AAN8I1G6_9EURO|nr:hypothetical protein OHC33_010048 [Knufia fluminis]